MPVALYNIIKLNFQSHTSFNFKNSSQVITIFIIIFHISLHWLSKCVLYYFLQISNNLIQRIHEFKKQKLDVLTNKLKEHIFYDYSVYTGSTGIALFFFNSAMRNGAINYELLKVIFRLYINSINLF